MKESQVYNNFDNEVDDELTINFRKIFYSLWSRKKLLIIVFISVLCLFILTTFITTKVYTVDTDLYINKSNNSNMAELNPYVLSDIGSGGGMAALMSGGSGAMANDIELMQSALVINKVIRDNDLRFGKIYNLIPTRKTGQYLTPEAFLKKGISFENKKGTNVVTITYKNKDRKLAYNVVNSIIIHYIELNKEINSEKSKSDKRIIEEEYNKAKSSLNKKMKSVSGLPDSAMSGSGNLAAMSAFSNSARRAMSTLHGQYVAGEKSKIAVTEDVSKVASLSSKLEWAKLVEEMSDSSKVIILKEPRMLKEYEQTSPKLFTNILLGIVFGIIAALLALIVAEKTDKKLTYSMLGDNVIYNTKDDFSDLELIFLTNQQKMISVITLCEIPQNIIEKLNGFSNINVVKGEISNEFIAQIQTSNDVVILEKIKETNSKLYKNIKTILEDTNKNIITESLI